MNMNICEPGQYYIFGFIGNTIENTSPSFIAVANIKRHIDSSRKKLLSIKESRQKNTGTASNKPFYTGNNMLFLDGLTGPN